jgi:hypothetical protein
MRRRGVLLVATAAVRERTRIELQLIDGEREA